MVVTIHGMRRMKLKFLIRYKGVGIYNLDSLTIALERLSYTPVDSKVFRCNNNGSLTLMASNKRKVSIPTDEEYRDGQVHAE